MRLKTTGWDPWQAKSQYTDLYFNPIKIPVRGDGDGERALVAL